MRLTQLQNGQERKSFDFKRIKNTNTHTNGMIYIYRYPLVHKEKQEWWGWGVGEEIRTNILVFRINISFEKNAMFFL